VTADVSDTDATPAPEASVNLTIDTTPPAAPVIDPIGGLDNVVSSQPGDADVIGVTDLGTTVTLSEGSTVLGDATVDGSGNWSYTLTGADLIAIGQGGGKTFSATATDAAGKSVNLCAPDTAMRGKGQYGTLCPGGDECDTAGGFTCVGTNVGNSGAGIGPAGPLYRVLTIGLSRKRAASA